MNKKINVSTSLFWKQAFLICAFQEPKIFHFALDWNMKPLYLSCGIKHWSLSFFISSIKAGFPQRRKKL
jgi:hypothetical protein